MITPAAQQKRQQLLDFIALELAPEPAVQAVIGIGSVASGLSRPDSDIDAVVFLESFDAYIVPAEFLYRPSDRTFHSIFSEEPGLEKEGVGFDFQRFDFSQWSSAAFEWPEGFKSELAAGWVAFDRGGKAAALIERRTAYPGDLRLARLDDAITWMDQHLSGDTPRVVWESLGPLVAHDRLQAAYEYLAQSLFALNRRWRPWRNREMQALLALPWLPENFASRALAAVSPSAPGWAGCLSRAEALRGLFAEVVARARSEGLYGEDAIGEAFIRGHEEPGRAWNMSAWNQGHTSRKNAA